MRMSKEIVEHNTKINGIERFEGIITRSNFNSHFTDLSPAFNFEEFRKKSTTLSEETVDAPAGEPKHDEKQHYMFFQNIASIKHYVDEILKMNPDEIDDLLKNGHDWASDHIATSKDDIQEVAEFIRNEMEGEKDEPTETELEEPTEVLADLDDSGVSTDDEESDDDDEEEEEEQEELSNEG
jgi:hypothetical protein